MLLPKKFSTLFTKEPEEVPQLTNMEVTSLGHIKITHEKIKKALQELKRDKSLGPDNLINQSTYTHEYSR